jgi:hypothetical protein
MIEGRELDTAAGVLKDLPLQACVLTETQIVWLWVLLGDIAIQQGKDVLAMRYLGSARLLKAADSLDVFGRDPKFMRFWKQSEANSAEGLGTLRTKGSPDGFWAVIDAVDSGTAQPVYRLSPGFHLFQTGQKMGVPEFSQTFEIKTGIETTLNLRQHLMSHDLSIAAVVKAPPIRPTIDLSSENRSSRGLALVGGAAMVVGLAQFGVSYWADGKFLKARSEDKAKELMRLNHATTIGGASFTAIGAGFMLGAVVNGHW